MEIQVEKNIPIPEYGNSRYPFIDMDIGDSFLAHNKPDPVKQSSIATIARSWALTNNKSWRFTVRKVDEGIRIWRIS